VLIGEPGVGKTAIAEGLAQRIVTGDVPETLKDKRVVSLDLSAWWPARNTGVILRSASKRPSTRSSRPPTSCCSSTSCIRSSARAPRKAPSTPPTLSKPALGRGEIQVIGATTLNEYRKHVEKDAALERRFQPVTVAEPTEEESVLILKGLRDKYEAHHKLKITDEAIEAAVKMSSRYINDRYLPTRPSTSSTRRPAASGWRT
jgi:ATP-dependent Clp protease ATP-binding subunit ClpC